MTAGRGIVHSEMPATRGRQHGLQLWVNLSSEEKMVDPNYQELESKDIPKVQQDGITVSIIAGEAFGITSPVFTRTPTLYLVFKLEPGAVLHQPIPESWNAFAYILEGESKFGSSDATTIGAHYTVLLGLGDGISVWNKSKGICHFVLIGGQPLNEPVFQYGPFVMNTREQVMQAVQDYENGRNGFERALGWQSDPVVPE